MKFNYALWQQLQKENRKSIGRNIVSFSLLRWTGFCTGPEANQNKKQPRRNKAKRENTPDRVYQSKSGAGETPNPSAIFPSRIPPHRPRALPQLIAPFASNQEKVMDSTCTLSTLIIVDVQPWPAPEFADESGRIQGAAHGASNTAILFPVTHSLARATGLMGCNGSGVCAHEPAETHTSTHKDTMRSCTDKHSLNQGQIN